MTFGVGEVLVVVLVMQFGEVLVLVCCELPSGGVSDAIWLVWASCGVCRQQMMIICSDITCGRKFSLMEVLYEESWREPGTMERMEERTRLSSGGMAPS